MALAVAELWLQLDLLSAVAAAARQLDTDGARVIGAAELRAQWTGVREAIARVADEVRARGDADTAGEAAQVGGYLEAVDGCLFVLDQRDPDGHAAAASAMAHLIEGLKFIVSRVTARDQQPDDLGPPAAPPTARQAATARGIVIELSQVAISANRAFQQGAQDAIAGRAPRDPPQLFRPRFPPPEDLVAVGLGRDQVGVLALWAEMQDRDLWTHYRLGLVAALAVRAGLVQRREIAPWLDPGITAFEMLDQADRRAQDFAAPSARAGLYAIFAAQIHHWFAGMWTYVAVAQPGAGLLLLGSSGYARLVDAAGAVWKGRIANPGAAATGEEPRWEYRVPLDGSAAR